MVAGELKMELQEALGSLATGYCHDLDPVRERFDRLVHGLLAASSHRLSPSHSRGFQPRVHGRGLYLNLTVPNECCKRSPQGVSSPIDRPQISSPATLNGAGSILWHEG